MSNRDAACDQISGATTASSTISETSTKAAAPTGVRITWSQRLDTVGLAVEDRRLRIDEAESDVDDEVDAEHERPEQQRKRLHRWVVLGGDGLHERCSQPGPGEDVLDQYGSRDQPAE